MPIRDELQPVHPHHQRMAKGKAEIPRPLAITAQVLDLRNRFRNELEAMPGEDERRPGVEYALEAIDTIFAEAEEFRYARVEPPAPKTDPPAPYQVARDPGT